MQVARTAEYATTYKLFVREPERQNLKDRTWKAEPERQNLKDRTWKTEPERQNTWLTYVEMVE